MPPAERIADWITGLVAQAGLATSLSGLRIERPDIATLANAAAAQWTGGFNPRPVGVDELARLYEAAR